MRWFRIDSGAVDNGKLQKLPGDLFKTWFNLMCLAGPNEGRLPDMETIAWRLRVPVSKCSKDVSTLINATLIDRVDETLVMHDWDEWQYVSKKVSTPRVRAFRDRKKRVSGDVSDDDETHDPSVSASVLFCSESGKEGSGKKTVWPGMAPIAPKDAVTEKRCEGLRALWAAGGRPFVFTDESALDLFRFRPPEIQIKICAHATWAFSSDGWWKTPGKTRAFAAYIESGAGESGPPIRTLAAASTASKETAKRQEFRELLDKINPAGRTSA